MTSDDDDLPRIEAGEWLRSVVGGRSYAEIGGLWNLGGELVSAAVDAGATEATKIDATPVEAPGWDRFRAHLVERGLAAGAVRCKSADLLNTYFPVQAGRFEVVTCRGLLQHLPDLPRALLNLRLVTTGQALVSSMVVPEVIENEAGGLDLRAAGALFAPALPEEAKAVLARHLDSLGIAFDALQPPGPQGWRAGEAFNLGPWWWFLTPRLIDTLATLAGFRVVGRGTDWAGRSYVALLET